MVCELTDAPARAIKELRYRTRDSWSTQRRVVVKAERLPGKANPHFVVTYLSAADFDARAIDEDLYAAREDMENRIKEQRLDIFADRVSAMTMSANHLRMWLSTFDYLLIIELRRIYIAFSSALPQQSVFRAALRSIEAAFP